MENFEDIFFDDLVEAIENLEPPKSGIGSFESGFDAAIDACVHKLHSFFGRPFEPEDTEEVTLDEIKQELLKAFIPSPSSAEHNAWNSAVRVCMARLAALFEADKEWLDANLPDFVAPAVDNDVNHPPYYNYGTMEVIDAIEGLQLPFHLGNALKYIARAGRKGPAKEDLQKAIWYINRYITTLEE